MATRPSFNTRVPLEQWNYTKFSNFDGTENFFGVDQVAAYIGQYNLGYFNVLNYGALKTGDDSDAFQAATDAARDAGGGIVYYPGSNAGYNVTRSIDSTGDQGDCPIIHMGNGIDIVVINHAFPISEAYPVIDGSGNTRGGCYGLTMRPSGTSYATCGYFAAKGSAGGGLGNKQFVANCQFRAGNGAGDCAVVFYNTDLSWIIDSECYSDGSALSMGIDKPANVTSKFITLSADQDWTQGYIYRCDLAGVHAPALVWAGGVELTISDLYAALTGAGSSKIIEVVSSSLDTQNRLVARGLRTENQSSAVGVTALYCTNQTQHADIVAMLETDVAGYMLGSASAHGAIYGGKIAVVGSTGALLNIGDQGLQDIDISGAATGLGTITSAGAAASWGVSIRGNIPIADITTAFQPNIEGLGVSYNGLTFKSALHQTIIPHLGALTSYREQHVIDQHITGVDAYTGGSGEVALVSDTLKAGGLQFWSGQITLPHLDYECSFDLDAVGAASTLAIQLVQGIHSVDLISVTPPVGSYYFKFKVRLYTEGNPTVLRADTELYFDNNVPRLAGKNVEAFGIDPAAGDITINVNYTSTDSVAGAEAYIIQIL